MTYKLTLDGEPYSPINWRDLTLSGAWQDDFWTVTANDSVDFDGEAYDYLRSLYEANYCDVVEVKIFLDDELAHQGFIYVSEIEWDLLKCTCNCSISDNGYLAVIENKAKQPYFLFAGKDSSNGNITPATTVPVDFHVVADGSSDGDRACYPIFDVFEYLISAMTDGEFLFASDFFTNGEGSNLYLTTGEQIRVPTPASQNINLEVSYQDLWDDLRSIYNLRGTIEVTGSTKTVRIEPFSYWRNAVQSVQVSQINTLTENVDTEQIYSVIEAGSSNYTQDTDETPNLSYPNTRLLTWDNESYPIIGQCVTQNTLNLSLSTFVVDSNGIENQMNGNTDQDRELFLIEAETTGYGIETTQYDTLGNGLAYYNQGLNNQSIIGRWADRIHNNPVSNNGTLLGNFEASLSTEQNLWDFTVPVAIQPDYGNVISDPFGDYNPASLNGLYTFPASGTYIVRCFFDVEITWSGTSPDSVRFDTAVIVNPFTYEIRPFTVFNPNTSPEQVSTIRYSWTHVFGIIGVISQSIYLATAVDGPIVGKYLTATKWGAATTLGGGSVPVIQRTETPLCLADFNAVKEDIKKFITIRTQKGWVNSIEYRPFGVSSLELAFTRND